MGPAGRTDVVLVCGGRWHDFDYARLQLLTELGGRPQARTRVFESYDCLDALAAADLLITYTCDVRPDAAQQLALVEFVAGGGRWLALHGSNSAIDAPQPGAERVFSTPRAFGPVAEVLGSQFLGHPPIAPYQVEIAQPAHPFVRGVQPFTVTDELYVSELHPPLDVLLHTKAQDFERSDRVGAEVVVQHPARAGMVAQVDIAVVDVGGRRHPIGCGLRAAQGGRRARRRRACAPAGADAVGAVTWGSRKSFHRRRRSSRTPSAAA